MMLSDDVDLYLTEDDISNLQVEGLEDSAAPYSSIASLTTLGTATGCASSFSSLSSFG